MPNLNKCFLIGALTRDVEVKFLPSGSQLGSFGLAVNRKWKDQSGNDKEEVLFIDCTAFGKSAETLAKYVQKGSPLHIEGHLRLEQWETQDGTKRSKIGLIVDSFQFLGGKPEGQQQTPGRPAQAQRPAQKSTEYRHDNPTYGDKAPNLEDAPAAVQEDDIPF